ncbi:hypothetical protein [Litoreibacter ponti]|uniref:hypothetical protein n=1 Tax=Litoreibacter ponti TaxID=1510457 RepID=UPI0011B25DF5|nr:hypothetical protein [Litoreibacter ponti]
MAIVLLATSTTGWAKCRDLVNVKSLASIGFQMMDNPSETYSIGSAQRIEQFYSQLERRKLRLMLDAQYKAIHFPEIMTYFAKLGELSKIIRLYGSREMRRYIHREKLVAQSQAVKQILNRACAETAKPAASSKEDLTSPSQLIAKSYAKKARPPEINTGPALLASSWPPMFLALLTFATLAIAGLATLLSRKEIRHKQSNDNGIEAILSAGDMRISGHIHGIDPASCTFAINPMQRAAAEEMLEQPKDLKLELSSVTFPVTYDDHSFEIPAGVGLSFRTPVIADQIDTLCAEARSRPIRTKKWRGLGQPRHSIQA